MLARLMVQQIQMDYTLAVGNANEINDYHLLLVTIFKIPQLLYYISFF